MSTPPGSGKNTTILIVGGYGEVGRRIAANVLETTNATVTLAGRRPEVAHRVAAALGDRATGVEFDVHDAEANADLIERHDLIITCLDLPDLTLPRIAAAAGRDYLDLTADADMIAWQRSLHDLATLSGSRIVPGVGLVPGLSNLLARDATCAAGSDAIDDVAILASLSLLGDHGPAAVDFMLSVIAAPPRQLGTNPAYELRRFHRNDSEGDGVLAMAFPFPDHLALPETLGVSSASSWLALDPPWSTRTLALLARSPLASAFGMPGLRHAVIGAIGRLAPDGRSGIARVDVFASGPGGARRASVEGVGQSASTAAAVAALVRIWIDNKWSRTPPGAHLPEEAFEPDEVFAHLPDYGLKVHRATP